MATGKALNGKPYAGNPHVRFDEWEVASCTAEASLRRVHYRRQPEGCASRCAATPRRGSLLYNTIINKIDKARRPSSRAAAFGRVALVTALLCAVASLPSFAEARSATLSATGYSGTETLMGFPALVKLSASNDAYGFSYSDCVNGKDDLWFTDSDGTLIPHDVDTWNETGDSYVWVRIPSLSNGAKIVMHWGAERTAGQTCTPADTWAGYVGVWHMNETGTTAEPDATANSLPATPKITSGTANINTADGKLGKGRTNVQNARLQVASTYKDKITTASQFTVSGWFNWSGSGSHPRLLTGNASTVTRNCWEVYLYASSGSAKLHVMGSFGEKGYSDPAITGSTGWAYLTVVFDGTELLSYFNGNPMSDGALTIGAAQHKNAFSIGAIGSTASRSFVGTIDEVRMYDGVVSADRAAADYATMNTPTAFLSLASDDTPVTAEWTGAAGNGDIANAANWNCYNGDGNKIDNALPTIATAVTVLGDSLNIQAPAGTSFECRSFTLGSAMLSGDCDLTGVDVVVAADATIDLKGYALFVKGLSGGGTITSTANANAAYTTLDLIQADNAAGSETARGEVVFCGTGTWSGVTIAPAVTVVKDCGGTLTRSDDLTSGMSGDDTAKFVLNDGTATFTATNRAGQAEFNVYGGTVNGSGDFYLGCREDKTTVWNQYGGAVSGNNFHLGYASRGTGIYNLSGGTLTSGSGTVIDIGRNAEGVGRFTVSSGTLTAGFMLRVGVFGTGTLDQSGGTVNVNKNYLQIGTEAGSVGTYTMTGGKLNASDYVVSVGRYGTGTLDVSGTAVVTASKGVRVGFTNSGRNGTGTLNVTDGGTVNTTSIYGDGTKAAQATVLFDGATVQALAAGDIIKNIANVTLGANGLTIDTAYDIRAANATITVRDGGRITKTGAGTFDLSGLTVQIGANMPGAFNFAVAGADAGGFTGLPTVPHGRTAKLCDDGRRCRISNNGFMFIVR